MPRWELRYGTGKKPEPFTPQIARAVRYKKNWDPELAAACVTGKQLLLGFLRGRKWSFPLHQRGVKLTPPAEELQQRSLGHLWRMRGTIVVVLGWIVTAMQTMKKPGLLATHAELGELCGVREDRIGQIMHELRRYGLVHQTPSFEAFGKVTSQRANVYRVTTLAYDTYALHLDRSALPPPESVAPRIARARKTRNELRPNPESTPVEIHPSGESSARAREGDRPSGMVVSTSSTSVFRTAVLDESPCLPVLAGVKNRTATSSDGSPSREALGRPGDDALLCPGVAELADPAELELARQRIGDALVDVKVGVVRDRDKIDPDDARTIDRHRAVVGRNEQASEQALLDRRAAEVLASTDIERERYEREQRQRGRDRERADDKARREEIRRQIDDRAPLEHDVLDEVDGSVVYDVNITDELRRHRESIADEKRELELTRAPRPKKPVDDDFADVIEGAWRTRFGAPTVNAQITLDRLRKPDDDDDGGAS